MSITTELNNKKIAILGLGIENFYLLEYLLKNKIKSEITICDQRSEKELGDKYKKFSQLNWQLGQGFNENLERFDILFRAPGWPIACLGIQAALKKKKTILSSPMKLFFELCPTKNIIGITGTKGKGTTSSLIYEIIKKSGQRVWLGGNIGVAPFAFLAKIKKNDWVVLELSSFQLEDMAVSPHIAVWTNFSPEHLAPADPNNQNYHKSLKKYWEAKKNIVKWQKKNDYSVLNSRLKSKITKVNISSRKLFFGKSNFASQLAGEHNQENVAAAVAVGKILKIKDEIIKKAVSVFKGLEHRLELVREYNGVKYYDDSFGTTPESTITAMKAFSSPLVLLAGGADKGADFKILAREIKKRVKYAVLLDGGSTPRIRKELLSVGFLATKMKIVYNIKDAVNLATSQASAGETVLLSTACASFGMFKNYKERGDLFKQAVNKLK